MGCTQAGTGEVDAGDASASIFPGVEGGIGSPIFFGGLDLRLAQPGAWPVPCGLYAVAYWAQRHALARVRSLTELASTQLRGIRELQPHGPYRLAGYGFGGLVAYEMAVLVEKTGAVLTPELRAELQSALTS